MKNSESDAVPIFDGMVVVFGAYKLKFEFLKVDNKEVDPDLQQIKEI